MLSESIGDYGHMAARGILFVPGIFCDPFLKNHIIDAWKWSARDKQPLNCDMGITCHPQSLYPIYLMNIDVPGYGLLSPEIRKGYENFFIQKIKEFTNQLRSWQNLARLV